MRKSVSATVILNLICDPGSVVAMDDNAVSFSRPLRDRTRSLS